MEKKGFRIYLTFHETGKDISVSQATLVSKASSHGDAVKDGLTWKDTYFPKANLENISVYER